MDTRAVRFGERMKEKGIKVYELDLPPFIDVKRKQLIHVHGAIPSHILPPPSSSFILLVCLICVQIYHWCRLTSHLSLCTTCCEMVCINSFGSLLF